MVTEDEYHVRWRRGSANVSGGRADNARNALRDAFRKNRYLN